MAGRGTTRWWLAAAAVLALLPQGTALRLPGERGQQQLVVPQPDARCFWN